MEQAVIVLNINKQFLLGMFIHLFLTMFQLLVTLMTCDIFNSQFSVPWKKKQKKLTNRQSLCSCVCTTFSFISYWLDHTSSSISLTYFWLIVIDKVAMMKQAITILKIDEQFVLGMFTLLLLIMFQLLVTSKTSDIFKTLFSDPWKRIHD